MSFKLQELEQLLGTMFHQDAQGRLVGDAPHVHIIRTADTVLCRVHVMMPDPVAAQLRALASAPRGRASKWAEEYAAHLSLVATVTTVTAVRAGPLYGFPDELPDVADCVAVDAANLMLLKGCLDEWIEYAERGLLMVVALAEGRAVSICTSVRASASAHCAGVETSPVYRGRGLAPRVVAAWAKLVRAGGAEPFYATTFDNIASQNVARRLRLNLIGSEFSIYGELVQDTKLT
jgi:GNAT superfamily N-acetyltransferase